MKDTFIGETMNYRLPLILLLSLVLLLSGCTQAPKAKTNITEIANSIGSPQNDSEIQVQEPQPNCSFDNGTIIFDSVRIDNKCANDTATLVPVCDNVTLDWTTVACKTGEICSQGKCAAAPVTKRCVENDSGIDLTVIGTVTYDGQLLVDKCEGRNVKEYYCENDQAQVTMRPCPDYYQCSNGACVPIGPVCINKGYYKHIDYANGSSIEKFNYCSSDNTYSVKYLCENGTAAEYVNICQPDEWCPNGNDTCQQRFCEGMNKINMSYVQTFKPAYVTYGQDTYYNKCDDEKTLKAYYCRSDNTVGYEKVKCTCSTQYRDIYNPYSDKTLTVYAGYCG